MESNHNPRLRKPVYYPLYYAGMFGGKGEIRTHTGHRMKVLHNHYATLPYRNTLGYIDSFELPKVATGESNVFLYGRPGRYCPVFCWLKANYFTLKFQARIGPCGRNRTGNLLIKSQLRYLLRHTGLLY
jgi:hypothetical protein